MIDLSYLTEDEQETILSVLKRDAELKHKEQQRIKKLQKTEQDKWKLKYLTGEWFYEAKSTRHRDKTQSADIIRASMKRRKPVTIMELTQIWPGKSSFLKNENKDIFIPPELSGIIGEPSSSAHYHREDHYQEAEYKPSPHPQTKPRQNPFNSKPMVFKSPVKTDFQTGANIQQIPDNSHQVPADHKPAVESVASLPKLYQAHQVPAEDHHEDLAEPRASQVSEPFDSLVGQGKVNQLSTEGQSHTIAEEDEYFINKVLGWAGMVSRNSAKGNERLGVLEPENREDPVGHGTSETENASHSRTEIKAKPSPKFGLGLSGLFLRKSTKVEAHERVESPSCQADDQQDSQKSPGLNFIKEEFEANPCLSTVDDRSDNKANHDIQQRESQHNDEGSKKQLTGLMSFWESRNKGPKVLSIKKSVTSENKVSDQKLLKINLSPSKAKTFEYTNMCESYKGHDETDQNPHDHGLKIQSTSAFPDPPIKQLDDVHTYKLREMSVRKTITEPDREEGENSSPMVNISTLDSMPKHYSQQDLNTFTSPNRVENLESCNASLIRELGELNTSSTRQLKQKSKRVPVNSPLDDTGMLVSGESIRNITSVSQDYSDESAYNTMTILEQPRTLSPRKMPEVLPRGQVKESRMVASPLRVFPIDISPTEKTPSKGPRHPPREQTKNLQGLSSAEESSPENDGKLLAERPEQHLLTFPRNSSEKNVQYQLTSPSSPPSFERSQAPGTTYIGNINSKQTRKVQSVPVLKGETSVQLRSPAHHRKATSKQSADGVKIIVPVVLTEQMQLNESSLAGLSIHLNCHHHLSLADSSHVSGFSDQPDKQEFAERISHSQQSQSESQSETFDSFSSTSPEACSLSWTSSTCGSSDGHSPVRPAQQQVTLRCISISKSLEDLATLPPKNERWETESRSGTIQMVKEATDTLSIAVLDSEQSKRLSVSVPDFIHVQGNGRESDCLSVNSFYSERPRKNSTNTSISASSGLASMSSVSGSVTNIYGTDFGPVEVKGTIQFAITYVNKLGELHIFVVQCRDLAVAELKRNRSDPYVKCYLLPDKAKLGKRKTSVKKKTLNPTYNEILRFKVPLESLKFHTLNISVWHNDTFGRNSFLGEVNMDLSEWDNNTHMMDYTLKGRSTTPSSPVPVNHNMDMCGDMRISLRFLQQASQGNQTPQTGEIQVWVKECTKLSSRRGTIDPFVKCSILPDNHQKNRHKTRVVKRTANPVFNHTMVYDSLRPEDLQDTCIELTVWDHDRLSNHFIGGTRLGLGTGKSHGTEVKWMDSTAAESALWRRMMESKNEWVEDTIPLRMLVMTR